jgi:ribose-phosphate pyrophosphokinase
MKAGYLVELGAVCRALGVESVSIRMGRSQVVRHRVLVPAFRRFESCRPSHFFCLNPGASAVAYSEQMKVFCGNGSGVLARGVVKHLNCELGKALVGEFSDGEIRVQIGENIRGADVFIMNSTAPPVNRNLMELLILIDAAKRASSARVTAVLPYFGYARQDRKDMPRVPIAAKLVANLIVAAGADRVLTLDLHSGQIQGFFDIPVDHLNSEVTFANALRDRAIKDNLVVVSPDTGSVKRAREIASRLEAPLAIIDKRRPKANQAEVMNVIGDVSGRNAVIFDDLVDTAGTLCNAANAVKDQGALSVVACCTHPVLSGDAVSKIQDSALEELLVGDSIGLSERAAACAKIKVITFAAVIGEAIRRVHEEKSVSILFR